MKSSSLPPGALLAAIILTLYPPFLRAQSRPSAPSVGSISFDERFGPAAGPGRVLDAALDLAKGRRGREVDRRAVDLAALELASFDPTRATEEQKRQLSEAWATLAKLTRRLDGDTDEALQQLRVASELDPKNEALAQEVRFQTRRQRHVELRLEAAAELRAGRQLDRGKERF